MLPEDEKQNAATINSNIAICYMKLKAYSDAIVYCDRSLEFMPLFLKPKANRAEAHFQLKNYEQAVAGELIRL